MQQARLDRVEMHAGLAAHHRGDVKKRSSFGALGLPTRNTSFWVELPAAGARREEEAISAQLGTDTVAQARRVW